MDKKTLLMQGFLLTVNLKVVFKDRQKIYLNRMINHVTEIIVNATN